VERLHPAADAEEAVAKAIYGRAFDVKKTLANSEGERPEFDEIRKTLTESVRASWWGGPKPKKVPRNLTR
jgi:hypothetical protein